MSNAMLSCMLPAFISVASVKLCLLNTLYVLRKQSICCVRPYGRYSFLCLLLKQGVFPCCCYGCRQTVFIFDFLYFIYLFQKFFGISFGCCFYLVFYIGICFDIRSVNKDSSAIDKSSL